MTTVATQKRFIDTFDRYTASVVQEAQDRTHARIRSIDEYLALRRDTSAIELCIFVIEIGLDIPPDVFEHPVMKRVLALAVDMVLVTNVSKENECDIYISKLTSTVLPGYVLFQRRASSWRLP